MSSFSYRLPPRFEHDAFAIDENDFLDEVYNGQYDVLCACISSNSYSIENCVKRSHKIKRTCGKVNIHEMCEDGLLIGYQINIMLSKRSFVSEKKSVEDNISLLCQRRNYFHGCSNLWPLHSVTSQINCGFMRQFIRRTIIPLSCFDSSNNFENPSLLASLEDYYDGSKSWLFTKMNIPQELSFLIRTYLCPPPVFVFEPGDIWLSFFQNPRDHITSPKTYKSINSIVARKLRL